jgi:hypothetical protein
MVKKESKVKGNFRFIKAKEKEIGIFCFYFENFLKMTGKFLKFSVLYFKVSFQFDIAEEFLPPHPNPKRRQHHQRAKFQGFAL